MSQAIEPAELAPKLVAIVREFAAESRVSAPAEGIGLDTRLEADLGLDSLSRSELVARLEQGLGWSLPEQAVLAATPRDLLELLAPLPAPATASGHRNAGTDAEGPVGVPASARSLVEVLAWHRDNHGSRVHITYYDGDDQPHPITYRALATGASRVAERLRRAGLRTGGTVAVMLPTGPEYFYSFFGILLGGGVPVPIYPPARPQQLEDHLRRHARILDNAGTGLLITTGEASTVARVLRAQVAALRDVVILDALSAELEIAAWAAPDAQDLAFLQYTSGSTGSPKGVMLSHADLLANIRAMGEAIDIRPDDVFVSWLPLYHDMGLIGAWLGSLYYAVPLVSMSPLAFLARPKRWLQAIQRHRGTLSAAPNFAYELCLTRLSDGQLEGLDLTSWRRAFNGAEPVSAETLRRFAERFAPYGLSEQALAPVYGLAEAAVGLAFPPPGRGPRVDCVDRSRLAGSGYALPVSCDDPGAMEIVACGRALPGYRVRVVDAQGAALPERHEGLLQFQGPSATRGYYHNPEATSALIHGEWHDTGDRAYLAGGDIHITGRVKDLIIRGGRNLYPYEVEQALGDLPGIRKGCVVAFAATDPRQASERLVIVAESKERDQARRAALRARALERATEVLGVPPDEIVLAPPRAVLKTSSGKLRRVDTRERYLSGTLFEQAPSPLMQLVRVTGAAIGLRVVRLAKSTPRQLYVAYAWSLLYLLAPWVWIAVMILPRPEQRWRAARGGVRLLSRLAFIKVAVSGLEHLPAQDQAFVLVANHESYLDAFAIVAAIERPLCFVAKQELAERRFVRRFLARMGTLLVERFDVRRSSTESRKLSASLAAGHALAFFPEGTFRELPGLLPFRMGAFAVAAQGRAPVVAAAIQGTRRLMPGDSFRPRPGRVHVAVAAAIIPDGTDWGAAVRLRDTARASIESMLAAGDRSLGSTDRRGSA